VATFLAFFLSGSFIAHFSPHSQEMYHGSIGHEPFTALEQWKIPRHRSLWVAVGYRARAVTGPSRMNSS